ncbi:MAG TPA: DUF1080 domain-containing protein [Pirellulales bacterium]|jgi:hypothetical protein
MQTKKSFAAFIAVLNILLWMNGRVAAAAEDLAPNTLTAAEKSAGWQLLFDGRTLDGWKPSENPESFTVRDGMIIAQGRGTPIEAQAPHPKCHLFYMGPDGHASFTDFEFQADIKCQPKANSGIYFHTEFLADAWPQKGFEIQIDNDPAHLKKSGSLYGVADITESPARDDEWFRIHLTVRGKRVVIKVNDQTVVDWTEPAGFVARHPPWYSERKLGAGTFALQGHDSESTVYFRNIRVRRLSE